MKKIPIILYTSNVEDRFGFRVDFGIDKRDGVIMYRFDGSQYLKIYFNLLISRQLVWNGVMIVSGKIRKKRLRMDDVQRTK